MPTNNTIPPPGNEGQVLTVVNHAWSSAAAFKIVPVNFNLPLASCRNTGDYQPVKGLVGITDPAPGENWQLVSYFHQVSLNSKYAKGATVTPSGVIEAVLPANYRAGQPLTLTVTGSLGANEGVPALGSSTVRAIVYKSTYNSSPVVNVTTPLLNDYSHDYVFNLSGSQPISLNPGDRLFITLEASLTETSGLAGYIFSVPNVVLTVPCAVFNS